MGYSSYKAVSLETASEHEESRDLSSSILFNDLAQEHTTAADGTDHKRTSHQAIEIDASRNDVTTVDARFGRWSKQGTHFSFDQRQRTAGQP